MEVVPSRAAEAETRLSFGWLPGLEWEKYLSVNMSQPLKLGERWGKLWPNLVHIGEASMLPVLGDAVI